MSALDSSKLTPGTLTSSSFAFISQAVMDKATWIDAFVLHMIDLGQLAERLWPHLGDIDPRKAAQGQHVIGDSRPGVFPDTESGQRG